MFTRNFQPDRFLQSVHGTQPLADFCRLYQIPYQPPDLVAPRQEHLRRWTEALGRAPAERQVQIELDLALVNEMAGADSLAHLLAATSGLPPPPDDIPSGPALALYFLLHHCETFHEVFFHREIEEVDSWRHVQAPGNLCLDDLDQKTTALAESLKEFFHVHEGTGRFCAVEAHRLPASTCFIASVADRVQLVEGFSDAGEPTTQRLRPAFPVAFVYDPGDGSLLIRSRLRARDRLLDLVQRFGRAVLGIDLPEECLGQPFHLDRLKRDVPLLPDAQDMEMVRVKALCLRYPERSGRRQLKLETRAGDDPSAMHQLLRSHLGGEADLDQLAVVYAELQVRLRVEGRSKNYLLRLWPDRSNLSQTALGERFHSCLKRWGLLHAR